MHLDIHSTIILIAALSAIAAASSVVLFASKSWFKSQYRQAARIRRSLHEYLAGGSIPKIPNKGFHTFLREYSRLLDEVILPEELESAVRSEILRRDLQSRWKRLLRYGDISSRLEAATFLGAYGEKDAATVLTEQIGLERSLLVKLRIAHSLTKMDSAESIPNIARTLIGQPDWYRYRLIEILLAYGTSLKAFLENELRSGNREVMPLAIAFSRRFMSRATKEHIVEEALSNGPYAIDAVSVLVSRAPERLFEKDFLEHPNPEIRGRAWAAFAQFPDRGNLDRLVRAMGNTEMMRHVAAATAEMVRMAPALLPTLLDYFETELVVMGEKSKKAEAISEILATRIDYFIYGGRDIKQLLQFLVRRNRTAALASFFRSNKNLEIEDRLIDELKRFLTAEDEPVLAGTLDPAILARLGMTPRPAPQRRSTLKIGVREKAFLWVLAAAIFSVSPFAFMAFSVISDKGSFDRAAAYVVEYSYIFAYYSLAVNGIYLVLLVLSTLQLSVQLRLWNQTRSSFLVTEKMMPPVSIIVPAYREEASIVENVRSLLSLDYPQYEIAVVCDGSPDATLERVIKAYSMEKSDQRSDIALPSAPIRGIYRCKEYPYLTLVDKANGGKADALNAGINFAKHEYLCCVDADSLLESDALLKIMYQSISDGDEMVACGGNIIPINGCEVRMGSISRYAAPKSPLAIFQTVEYLRAFLAGRLGWAYIRSLLIISGAFGVFSRRRVLEIGGYLTGEGSGKFDTVGEDMELVVRLSRHMRKKRLPFRISYAFNANCWTEVPEDRTSLMKQRSRWHRGLLEILLYHRRCAFNPRYGTMGLIGIPYFFIFEVIGPFFEFFGLLMIPISAVWGLLSLDLAALLFAATILFGIVISTASLAISEFRVMYFSRKETVKLLLFAILENFGYRQAMSFLRVSAYFDILRGTSGWGAMKRKGFSSTK